jgi:hypothetical protein
MTKPRLYKTRRGAEKRKAQLEALFPGRAFWIAPTQSFRFAVYTTASKPNATDPNAVAICA